MMIYRYGGLFIAGFLFFTSCAARKNKLEKMQIDCSQRVSKALLSYNAKKYATALTRFTDARMQCSGTPVMDTILYYLGMSNVKTKKYLEARTEFQRLVQDFPGSPFFEEAKFRIGYVVFKQSNPANRDQKETRETIRLLDNFMEMYPKSPFADSALFYRTEAYEKLATKEFWNAQFYENVNEPEAAVVYYRAFLSQFIDSKRVDQARFNSLVLLVKLDRITEAEELYDELIEKCKNKELQKEAKALFANAKKAKAGAK
ncbi:MAG: outer membrane protein assembly factor BamD [Chitinispirillaceae bacterium]|nr:outer membrane protein assembly factor BamD [Chitinispirillaceae bacterium]